MFIASRSIFVCFVEVVPANVKIICIGSLLPVEVWKLSPKPTIDSLDHKNWNAKLFLFLDLLFLFCLHVERSSLIFFERRRKQFFKMALLASGSLSLILHASKQAS